jgi:hypothetical protein
MSNVYSIAFAVICWAISVQQLQGEQKACLDWESKVKGLNFRDRSALDKYGAIHRSDWVFSSRLIPSCSARHDVANYFERVIKGSRDESVVRFGWLHSDLLNRVVLKVWPLIGRSEAVPNDGSFSSESWALLRQPWMNSSTLISTLRYEIRLRGLSSEVVYTLMDRPQKPLANDIRAVIRRSKLQKKESSLFEVASASVLLHIFGDVRAHELFMQLELRNGLSAEERAVIAKLHKKATSGEPILWSDLEPLVTEW